jgi:DNA-binding transcriptional MerR regulator
VIERTGITPRQLQWWDERGVVVPRREGHRRLYSPQALAEIAVICELRRRGISLQKVRKVVRLLQKEFGRRLVQSGHGTQCHLLTDGRSIYIQTSAQQVLDVLSSARQPMFAICLSETVRRVSGRLRSRQNWQQRGLNKKPPRSEPAARQQRRRKIS